MIPHGIGEFLIEKYEGHLSEPSQPHMLEFGFTLADERRWGRCHLFERARHVFSFQIGSCDNPGELLHMLRTTCPPVNNYEVTSDGDIWLNYPQTIVEPIDTFALGELFEQAGEEMVSFESFLKSLICPANPEEAFRLGITAGQA